MRPNEKDRSNELRGMMRWLWIGTLVGLLIQGCSSLISLCSAQPAGASLRGQAAATWLRRKFLDADPWICAIDPQRDVQCWLTGKSGHGGAKNPSSSFQKLADLHDVIALDGDSSTLCALNSAGEVACWGESWPDRQMRTTPQRISLPHPVRQLVAGAATGCALLESGEVYCWGVSACENGKVSENAQTTVTDPPAKVSIISDVVQLSASGDTRCALDKRGDVICWGHTWDDHCGWRCQRPKRMLRNASAIAGLCGIAGKQREVYCWGGRDGGQSGEYDRGPESYCKATKLRGLKDVKQIAVGAWSGLALTSEGEVYYWGESHTGGILDLGNEIQAPDEISLEHALKHGELDVGPVKPKPEVVAKTPRARTEYKRYRLAPLRLPHVDGVRGLISSGHYDCLELEQGGPLCEFVLGRQPFHLEKIWPSVRFDSGRGDSVQ
jgi:hypothetical protein